MINDNIVMIIVGSAEMNHTEWEWGRGRGSGSSGFSRDEPLQGEGEGEVHACHCIMVVQGAKWFEEVRHYRTTQNSLETAL